MPRVGSSFTMLPSPYSSTSTLLNPFLTTTSYSLHETMIRPLPPPSYSRSDEILSRYRPIAPKPDTLPSASAACDGSLAADGKIQHSPYLKNLWSQLHARHPIRTRKRGRTPSAILSSSKKHRTMAPAAHASVPSPFQDVCGLNHAVAAVVPGGTGVRRLATLPLLPGLDTSLMLGGLDCQKEEFVMAAAAVPEEKDLLRQLQVPCMASHQNNNNPAPVISPNPVSPVGSSIVIGSISESLTIENPPPLPRKSLEVEEEVESETLPVKAVSDVQSLSCESKDYVLYWRFQCPCKE